MVDNNFNLQAILMTANNFLDNLVLYHEPEDPLDPHEPQMDPKMDPARLFLGDPCPK